ncbi:hypothetical protein [Pleionea sediminis]|uniref:hypothetical protein n=1 Tax=Pleionea sediminis TaxID=2569479 RepID=UPI0011860021|nr:hypothetical protein [Pleionea sediminis]
MRLFYIFSIVTLVFSSNVLAKEKQKDKQKKLPPGLQKKVERGQPLPPGWQKKLKRGDILGNDIYRRGEIVVPLDDRGRVTLSVDGTLIRLYQNTREIIDILSHK